MNRNLKLLLAYDGAGFHGWQTQPGMRTVQFEVEQVLRRILRHPLALIGASRTDAGVHARGQVASVRTTEVIPVSNLLCAIGHHLPADIALLHVSDVSLNFNARRSAIGKLYRYTIHNTQIRPVRDGVDHRAWHYWHPLDVDRLRAGAASLVGTHDFVAFATRGSPRPNTVRTVRRIDIRRRFDTVLFDIEGTGFLYNQVRNMVGTLVEVGRGHWPPECIAQILASRSRASAGPTAPPQGLSLEWVRYPPSAAALAPCTPVDRELGTAPTLPA